MDVGVVRVRCPVCGKRAVVDVTAAVDATPEDRSEMLVTVRVSRIKSTCEHLEEASIALGLDVLG